MNTAKDELNTTMKLIAKVLIFKRWWRKMRFLKKVDKKLTLAEQGIKSRRMNMLTIQVTTLSAIGIFKEIVLQDKCDSSLLESKERLLRNASKGLQEEQEKEEEEEEEPPKPKEQLSFAEIMKLAKAPKVEKKKEPVKPILKVTKAPKMTKEEIKEKFTQLKYEVRSINHKGQQLHDNCLKDRSRIEQVLKVTLAEVDRLKEAEKEADSL